MVNGVRLMLGNHRLIHEQGLCGPELEAGWSSTKQGRTVTLWLTIRASLALFAVADTIREHQAGHRRSQGTGVTSVMLTGDNTATAKAIAAQAGIDDARGDLLPEAKLDAIKEMQKRYGATGMTGDGINDAPAGAGRHRFCHGCSGNRHGHGSGRCGHHER